MGDGIEFTTLPVSLVRAFFDILAQEVFSTEMDEPVRKFQREYIPMPPMLRMSMLLIVYVWSLAGSSHVEGT